MALWDMYVGTFTAEFQNSVGAPMGDPGLGVERFRFDDADGSLSFVDALEGLASPSFLAHHPRLPLIYTVERRYDVEDPRVGALTALAVGPDGELRVVAKVNCEGASPSHVSVHPSGGHAYVVNYVSGHVAAFPLDEAGVPAAADTVILHDGPPGPTERQQSPHPHQIRPLASGAAVLVTDLGLDSLTAYPTDPQGRLTPVAQATLRLPPGAGPRHLAIHPSGRWIFVIGEFDAMVHVFTASAGVPGALRASVPLFEEGDDRRNAPSEIVLHPDERTLFVGSRYVDYVVALTFEEESGSLQVVARHDAGGRIPRNINLDRTGRFLLVANQTPGNLTVMRGEGDLLEPVADPYPARSPSCILFAKAPRPS